jgi:uncharacterized protein (TIGR00730 family)
MIKSVCVFCSASARVIDKYGDIARETGAHLAQSGYDVVYGGSRSGLMGIVADSALEHGSKVYGVIPEFLINREISHPGVTEQYLTQTMHERQMKMSELADAFVIIPGGMGTLAEFFEVTTWRILGIHNKPVIVVNAHGFWTPMLEMIEKAAEEGFLYGPSKAVFDVVDHPTDIKAKLEEMMARD